MKKIAILGASGHGKVVAEIAELSGWDVVFFDDKFPEKTQLEHWPIKGTSQDLANRKAQFDGCFVAIGNNKIRLQKMAVLETLEFYLPSLIHPSAEVSSYATIEQGSVVMAKAVINPFTKIAQGCIVNTSSTIDHDCELAEGVHISPGANLAGAVKIGPLSWIGIGSSIKQCVSIGSNVMIGAGAAVVNDIDDSQTVAGVPAKPLY